MNKNTMPKTKKGRPSSNQLTGKAKHNKQIILRASKSDVWSKCSGFAHNDTGDDDLADRSRAEKGTDAHSILADLLSGKSMDKIDTHGLSDEYIEYAKEAASHIGFDLRSRFKTAKLQIEKRLGYTVRVDKTDWTISGQYDAAILTADTIHVYDFKSGMGEVEARNNKQLQVYACLIYLSLSTAQQAKIKTLSGTIIQPSLGVVSHDVFNIKEPENFLYDMIVKIANNPDTFTTGEQCRYCNHNDVCKTYREKREKFLYPEFAGEIENRPERWLEILEIAKPLKTLIETVEAKAKAALEAGDCVPGLKLGYTSGKRTWVSDLSADQIAKLAGLKKSDIVDEKLKTLTQVLKIAKTPDKLAGCYTMPRYAKIKIEGADNGYFD
jgi:hypothetical protein